MTWEQFTGLLPMRLVVGQVELYRTEEREHPEIFTAVYRSHDRRQGLSIWAPKSRLPWNTTDLAALINDSPRNVQVLGGRPPLEVMTP